MKEHSVGKNLTAGTKTTMYTVPAGHYVKWNLLYAHNSTASAKAFSAWWYDKSENVEVVIFDSYPLDSKGFLKMDGGSYIVLEEGDEIRVQAETGSTCSAVITITYEQKHMYRNGV